MITQWKPVMKNFRKELWFEVSTPRAFINITPLAQECLCAGGIKEGFVSVNTKHI